MMALYDKTLSYEIYENKINDLLSQGQFFLAQDKIQEAMHFYPHKNALKKLLGMVYLRTGALQEARDIIEPLTSSILIDEKHLMQTIEKFHLISQKIAPFSTKTIDAKDIKNMGDFALYLHQASQMMQKVQNSDNDHIALLGHIYKSIWQISRKNDDLQKALDLYKKAYHQNPSSHFSAQIALLHAFQGHTEPAIDFARKTIQLLTSESKTTLKAEDQAEKALCYILLHQENPALEIFNILKYTYSGDRQLISTYRRELLELKHAGFSVSRSLFECLAPPTIVSFTGHMIDGQNRSNERFPDFLEPYVKEAMQEVLQTIKAEIGYSAAASGGDIIFLESLLERDGEINIILPFDQQDFITQSVQPAGNSWVRRFHHLMRLAHHTHYATEENYLNDDILFQFGGLICFGESLLRAHTLYTSPHLVAVWNGEKSGFVGGTDDLIARWHDTNTCHIIDTKKLLEKYHHQKTYSLPEKKHSPLHNHLPDNDQKSSKGTLPDSSIHSSSGQRVIRTMLFADVKGFSLLKEQHVPYFIDFLSNLAANMTDCPYKPEFINTWGDAIFAVFDKATDMAYYAMALKKALNEQSAQNTRLPTRMALRIGLHAGPAYKATDPLTHNINFYGSHVNRAARIEPITTPNRIYASEKFIALLAAEESALKTRACQQSQEFNPPWTYEYIGCLALAKKFGEQKIYHLREK